MKHCVEIRTKKKLASEVTLIRYFQETQLDAFTNAYGLLTEGFCHRTKTGKIKLDPPWYTMHYGWTGGHVADWHPTLAPWFENDMGELVQISALSYGDHAQVEAGIFIT